MTPQYCYDVTDLAFTKLEELRSIKDISHPIKFTLIKNQDIYNASLVFDRSKYDIRFNSGSFFENLGDKLILDEIKLTAELKLK